MRVSNNVRRGPVCCSSRWCGLWCFGRIAEFVVRERYVMRACCCETHLRPAFAFSKFPNMEGTGFDKRKVRPRCNVLKISQDWKQRWRSHCHGINPNVLGGSNVSSIAHAQGLCVFFVCGSSILCDTLCRLDRTKRLLPTLIRQW